LDQFQLAPLLGFLGAGFGPGLLGLRFLAATSRWESAFSCWALPSSFSSWLPDPDDLSLLLHVKSSGKADVISDRFRGRW